MSELHPELAQAQHIRQEAGRRARQRLSLKYADEYQMLYREELVRLGGVLPGSRRFTPRPSVPERFWPKVKVAGPEACWPWLAGTNGVSYGRLKLDGEYVGAHRIAWILEHGPIPPDRVICHRCDNPSCCNPRHLFLGTHLDNARDREAKGRGNHVRRREVVAES